MKLNTWREIPYLQAIVCNSLFTWLHTETNGPEGSVAKFELKFPHLFWVSYLTILFEKS